MHLAEAYSQIIPKDSTKQFMKNIDSLEYFDATILKEFHISQQKFNQDIEYYKTQPQLLDSIYQLILSELTILQAKQNNS